MSRLSIPSKPWNESKDKILRSLSVSPDEGLKKQEIYKRRKIYGLNYLRESRSRDWWLILIDQLKSLIVLLLIAATILSFIFDEYLEAIAIIVVIFINSAIGFFTELKAVQSMHSLRRLTRVNCKVIRDGSITEIPAQELVPGDIVVFEGGDIVTADIRIIEASKLQTDESTLTGESQPVSKIEEAIGKDTILAERKNMLFKGTAVTRGSGKGVVVVTGMATELGQISSLVDQAHEEITPLEKRLNRLGKELIWITLAITGIVALIGIIRGREVFLMIETSIALAVAAIPEGLPIVATLALARGMIRMAGRNALVNRLSAVETLGATNVIFTDKTGTLTENRMSVTRVITDSVTYHLTNNSAEKKSSFISQGKIIDPNKEQILFKLLETGVLCNNASIDSESQDGAKKSTGDPLEIALLTAGEIAAIEHDSLLKEKPELREVAFDPEVKMMATFNEDKNGIVVSVKGAPEVVLEACSFISTDQGEQEIKHQDRAVWLKRTDELAKDGLRVLALATKTVKSIESNPYEQLVFLGLVGMNDPPRSEIKESIAYCKDAGIRVIMVTGDQPVTAHNIAWSVGLIDNGAADVIQGKEVLDPKSSSSDSRESLLQANIFARVSPSQKLDLISLHQKAGSVVAMTGDGVNDAPALKKADIGVAMGKRGTQVACEASDMILKDDSFSTIVVAIQQGRIIFNNIRKFVIYLMSCNVSEIMTVTFAYIVNLPLPILPLHILFLNLVTDVFPALALGLGEGHPNIMKKQPRASEQPILSRQNWISIGIYGLIITLMVLISLSISLYWFEYDKKQAVTISFLTLAFAQLWHVFNMRDKGSSFISNDIIKNPYIWGALALCTVLIIAAIYLPGLAEVLSVVSPPMKGWALVIIMSIVPLVIGQILRLYMYRHDSNQNSSDS
ncbi:MAG: HAD-IC family P-type ATPase [Candidatus Dadabacteria bacterium]|nr:HAD-IC family P-type ATPase [Candidatus Dadabacteria bacterium]NIT13349.1 HAD-IC family P-type ATPase [Candidatus Dadabacteria bacterium]